MYVRIMQQNNTVQLQYTTCSQARQLCITNMAPPCAIAFTVLSHVPNEAMLLNVKHLCSYYQSCALNLYFVHCLFL